MKLERGIVLLACLALTAGAFGQDSLLGKKKGTGGGGHSSPPRQSSSPSRSSGSTSGTYKSDPAPQRWSQPSQRSENDLLQRGRRTSRSGRVNYGSMNNIYQPGQRWQPVDRAPSRDELDRRRTSMRDQIRREDRPRVRFDYNDGRVRVGYYQYDSRWRDDRFCYPYYVFNPYQTQTCIVSPWYYYPTLPAYIDTSRVYFGNLAQLSFVGFPYDYQPYRSSGDDRYDDRGYGYDDRYSRRNNLDYAIDDLVDAFERQDRRALDRLVPRNGTVTVRVDSTIAYALSSDDFYDMLTDAVMSSKTVSYHIESVRKNDDQAEVVADHQYLDPWGQRQEVFHRFNLVAERGQIVIRFFGTSNNPNW